VFVRVVPWLVLPVLFRGPGSVVRDPIDPCLSVLFRGLFIRPCCSVACLSVRVVPWLAFFRGLLRHRPLRPLAHQLQLFARQSQMRWVGVLHVARGHRLS
jgi:hypothetical protein